MILLGLGSNLGDRADQLARAKAALRARDMEVVAESSIHETPALMPDGAPESWDIAFLNQVIAVKTTLAPLQLLEQLKALEVELGRTPRDRWAPREIDLDIIAYDDVVLNGDALQLPHPHMHTRRFVLSPLVEIAADWVHPVLNKTSAQLLAEIA